MKNSAGKDDGNHVMTYASSDILSHEDIQLTQGGLVLIGVLAFSSETAEQLRSV